MKLQIEIGIKQCPEKIEHHHSCITLGSCFADSIAEKLSYYKCEVLRNPFGVLYNPQSIEQSIRLLAENSIFTNDNIFFSNGEWHSFFHHSDFSHHDRDTILTNINQQLQLAKKHVEKTDFLFITYGTSIVYRHINENRIVSNCHKLAPNEFSRERLGLPLVIESMRNTFDILNTINPRCKIIVTVSPVRYWAWDAHENQLSKAILFLAIEEIIANYEHVYYFPAYEIVMDELRDYRFYKEDMVHPNSIAVDYIWEKFTSACCSEECLSVMKDIEKMKKAYSHKVRNAESQNHKLFLKQQLVYLEKLQQKYPYIDFTKEHEYFAPRGIKQS